MEFKKQNEFTSVRINSLLKISEMKNSMNKIYQNVQ